MTPAQLRKALAALLKNQLGTYKQGGASRGAAIYVGDPPSDYRASGVEVRIDPSPEFDNRPLHRHTAVVTELTVRVIPHGASATKATLAAARICTAYGATNPVTIPGNESLGILTQHILRIRS